MRSQGHAFRCLLVAGALDTGGVESIVAMLAEGLAHHGIEPVVACSEAGRTAQMLRRRGIDVRQAADGAALRAVIRDVQPDVIQLHRPDANLARTVRESGRSAVTVFHAMETYLDETTWAELGALLMEQRRVIAVSASVLDFIRTRLPVTDHRAHVIVNGSPLPVEPQWLGRADARRHVSAALGCDLGDDRVVVSLSRFSDQKNVPGLVDAFLGAVEEEPRLRLIVAGEPQNWLEVRRADALRRGHPSGDRVHLLGTSDAHVLLRAADLFALNSFAEGGPLSAVEAVVYGLPVVVSDVGFARQLVASEGVTGIVVPRANPQMTTGSMARARRSRHQFNHCELSRAILTMSEAALSPQTLVPPLFSEEEMVAAHAQVLKQTASTGLPSQAASEQMPHVPFAERTS